MKQIEWIVQIVAGSYNLQVKCSKSSAVNVQLDNRDSAVCDYLMFIHLATYLPNTISEKGNMQSRKVLHTVSSLGGKGIYRLQVRNTE